ncbi:MAG: hypothetical protein RJA36_1488 [Pseudomonadota bacterium]|jgi:hypothetical protein
MLAQSAYHTDGDADDRAIDAASDLALERARRLLEQPAGNASQLRQLIEVADDLFGGDPDSRLLLHRLLRAMRHAAASE